MTIKIVLIILLGLTIFTGLFSFFKLVKYKKTNDDNKQRYLRSMQMWFIPFCCYGFMTIICLTTIFIAKQHGLYDYDIKPKDFVSALLNTPKEDNLPDNINDSLILYYRFSCSDCEDIYDDLRLSFLGYDNVYWISSRSEQGKTLMEQYPVEQVPAGVYIDKNGIGHTYLMAQRTEDGGATLANDSVERLKELMYLDIE